jgi:hypothetical protein
MNKRDLRLNGFVDEGAREGFYYAEEELPCEQELLTSVQERLSAAEYASYASMHLSKVRQPGSSGSTGHRMR